MPPLRGKGGRHKITPTGKWSDTARARLDLARTTITLYIDATKDGDNAGEEGPDIYVGLSRSGELMYMNLTTLTHTELCSMRELFDIAFANAEPICKDRDRLAQEALENGDDSFSRIYRRVPEILIREGQKWAHYPRLRRGRDWIGSLVPEFHTRVQDVRGSSSGVPESVEEDPVAQDGESEAS